MYSWIEALIHHIAFRNDFADRQAVTAIAHGDLGNQAQMAGDELVRRLGVLVLEETLGEHVFFLRFQHWELANFSEVTVETVLAGRNRRQFHLGHDSTPLSRKSASFRQASRLGPNIASELS